jgi:dihydrofolate reductase
VRNIILSVAVNLDGYIEGANGEYDWCIIDKDYSLKDFLTTLIQLLFDGNTYKMSPEMEGGPAGFPKFKEYIFSTTLSSVKKGAILIKGNVKREVEKIKKEKRKRHLAFRWRRIEDLTNESGAG